MDEEKINIEDIETETEITEEKKKTPGFFSQLLSQIVIALILFFILINFVLIPCVVDGTSMFPTLHEGDFGYSFIISKLVKINRFDIAVIRLEEDDKLLVKRIIGMPNDLIEYKDNKLYINGEYMEETFLSDDAYTADFSAVLDDDEYFCLGDNRSVSRDSRYYGAFRSDQIVSTHLFVIKPLSDFGMK